MKKAFFEKVDHGPHVECVRLNVRIPCAQFNYWPDHDFVWAASMKLGGQVNAVPNLLARRKLEAMRNQVRKFPSVQNDKTDPVSEFCHQFLKRFAASAQYPSAVAPRKPGGIRG